MRDKIGVIQIWMQYTTPDGKPRGEKEARRTILVWGVGVWWTVSGIGVAVTHLA